MSFPSRDTTSRGLLLFILSVAALLGPFHGAQAVEPPGTALDWIPQDAVFYRAWLRNREQLEAVAASRAWAKIRALPACREGVRLLHSPEAELAWRLLRSRWDRLDTSVAQGQVLLEDPQIRRAFETFGDMLSDEVFVYGDATCLDTVRLLRRITAKMRQPSKAVQWDAETGALDEKKSVGSPVFEACLENLPCVHTPNLVFGFHLRDRTWALEQLSKLELLGHLLAWADPRWKGRVEKQRIGDASYLVFSLDGTMLPEASLINLRRWAARDEDAEKLIAHLRQLPLVVALGIRGDYLLLSIGESTDALTRLDQSPRLAELPECQPLVKAAVGPLISAAFVDEKMQAVLAEPIGKGKSTADGPEQSAPKPGAYVSFRLWVDRGIECYAYDHGERPELEAMSPFRLLEHAGGRPILAASLRSTFTGRRYDLAMDWLAEGADRVEDALAEKLSPSCRATLHKTTVAVGPLANYLRHVLRGMLAMALADGQALVVLDADATTTSRWQTLRGESKPMPLPEPAVVLDTTGVNNVRRVLAEGRRLIQSLLAAVGLLDPAAVVDSSENLQESMARPPKFYTLGNWTAPSLGLAESEAVVSLSREHAARLLEPMPLEIGLFADTRRDRVLAYAFDHAGLIDALRPWFDVGARRLAGKNASAGRLAAVADHLHALLDVLAVFRAVSTEVYREREAWVTHTLIEIRDVE